MIFMAVFGGLALLAAGSVPAASLDQRVDAFTQALEANGFMVQEGRLDLMDLSECEEQGTCYGNNPTSAYFRYMLPPGPGEPDLPVGLTSKEGRERLRPDEALVFIGKTPPALKYFSFQTYVFARYDDGEEGYREIFANLGDAINNLTIGTSPGPTAPYDAETVVISTGDGAVDALVRNLLQQQGFSNDVINTEILSPKLLKMGYDEYADIFVTVLRLALFADPDVGESYLNHPQARVLRVTPATPVASHPLPIPRLRERGTGTTEKDLRWALDWIVRKVRAENRKCDRKEVTTPTLYYPADNFECLLLGLKCNGFTRDTLYMLSMNRLLPATDDDFIVVAGVNHEMTGKATYSNLAVYNLNRLLGVRVFTGEELLGSADAYIPYRPLSEKLFVVKIARDCGSEPYCMEVPTDTFPGAALDEPVLVATRAYLEPSTAVGPDPQELLMDRVMFFSSEECKRARE